MSSACRCMAFALLLTWASSAQIPVSTGGSGGVRVFPSDLAIFEAGEDRRDLPCAVAGSKALL
ncbi:MAG TPA: hypothetical protein VES20_07415, partial [Bryobacteraceae bacterium]|nr:hypothetical protein [Bryobacteraceae bacterium]